MDEVTGFPVRVGSEGVYQGLEASFQVWGL